MKNNLTELVFILDRSGSMAGLEKDTIGGFNAAVGRQREVEGECLVTAVLFNTCSQTVYDRAPLDRISPMTGRDYVVGGCTALLDALGETITHIAKIHRYIRPEDVPEHTTFVIMTDGMENASRRFDVRKVKALIQQQQEKGWEFLFLGANIDSVATAGQMGIQADRAVDYCADSQGTANAFETVAEAVCAQRTCAAIPKNWKARVQRDTDSRR